MYKIDAHNHPDFLGVSFDEFIRDVDRNGITKTWLLSWETPAGEYEPGSAAILPSALYPSVAIPFSRCLEYKQRAPERIVLGYAPDPRRPEALDQMRTAIRTYGVEVCGEVKLRMMYDNPDAIDLFRLCGEYGIPVTLHFDYPDATRTGHEYPRRNWWYGGGIDTLERVLRLCPETNFLGHAPGFWCHLSDDDQGLTTAYPQGPIVPGGKIERLLEQYPNLYCDCSAGSFFHAARRDYEYTSKLIQTYPDRFLYARDTFANYIDEIIPNLNLPEDVLEALYHGNAERLLAMRKKA